MLLDTISIIGTIVGCIGALLSWLSLRRIKKVDGALDSFKTELLNKKKEKKKLEAFNVEKKVIYKKAQKLLAKAKAGINVEEVAFTSELNQLVALSKRMISNHKELFDLAGISESDQAAFIEFMDMVQKYNDTGVGDPSGKMIECIKRLEIICEGKDVENELQ